MVIQFALFAAIAAAGLAGPAWDGVVRVAATLAGGSLLVAGLLLAIRGLLDLREALTPLPHPRAGASLVDTGAYGLVRHPIYGGIIVGSAGYGLVTASPLALVGAAVLLGFFRLKSAREESWLETAYPGYAAYRARTRRFIPLIY